MENLQLPKNKPLVIIGIILLVLLFCCCCAIVAYSLLEGPLSNGFSRLWMA
jgi:hypothetical protein